jgi:uncharacterized protein (TIGR02453 family)
MPLKKAASQQQSVKAFAGFPAAGIQFLRDLKLNNDRDWFRERKHIYQEQVEQPMAMLVTEAASRSRKRGLAIGTKDKNPVMRVYRDIRFSPDKRPFKSHVGASLQGTQKRSKYGEIYIHISPEESFLAAGFWMPERPFLQAWRESMIKAPDTFLRVVKSLAKSKLELSSENCLTRLPRGYDSYTESELAKFLKLTSYVTTRPLTPKEIRSPQLVDLLCEFTLATKPLLEYGWNLKPLQRRDILDER